MSNPLAMSSDVQAFLGEEGAGLIKYSDFGVKAVEDASALKRAEMEADALRGLAKIKGDAALKIMEDRTAVELLRNGPQKPSGFQRVLSGVQNGLEIVGGLKGMGAFGSGTPITDGFDGLGGFGPTAGGDAYGGFLDATAGTTGMGPLMSGDAYGSFLSRP